VGKVKCDYEELGHNHGCSELHYKEYDRWFHVYVCCAWEY
jgi:hypothetical protein